MATESLFITKDELQEKVEKDVELLALTIDPIVGNLVKLGLKPGLADMVRGYLENIKLFRQIYSEEKKATLSQFYHRATNVVKIARAMAQDAKFIEISALTKDGIYNLRQEIDKILNSLENRVVNIGEDLEVVYSPVGDKAKIKTVEHRLKLLEAGLEKLSNESDLVIGRARSASKLVERLSEDFGSRFDATLGAVNARINTLSEEFDEKHRQLEEGYEEKKYLLDLKVKDLDNLMQIAARKAMAGGYMRNAHLEGRVASNFRWAAIALMSIAAYAVILIVFVGNFAEMNPMFILQKSLAFLFVTFIIAYLVRQSAVHRAQQQKYMQTALDIGALKPFVATLPEDVKNEILKEFAQKLFNPKDVVQVAESGFGVNELLGKFIDKLELPKEKSAKE